MDLYHRTYNMSYREAYCRTSTTQYLSLLFAMHSYNNAHACMLISNTVSVINYHELLFHQSFCTSMLSVAT